MSICNAERHVHMSFPLLGWLFVVCFFPVSSFSVVACSCRRFLVLESNKIKVCVAHLRSSAGTLPRQHVFLHTAVGAMATMNLSKRTSDTSGSPISGCDGGTTAASARRGKSYVPPPPNPPPCCPEGERAFLSNG